MLRRSLYYGLGLAGIVLATSPALAQSESIAALPVEGIVAALQNNGRVSMSGTHFESDSADLLEGSGIVLAKLAESLGQLPDARLAVIGHTDSTGDFVSNVDLSERRAQAIVNALVANFAILGDRLVALGAGPIDPVASNATEGGRASYRRILVTA
ncbi:MAG: OmpA family protein [Hyphomicrobiales bacterium]|nr:OmpA family protein [Hyphomicrobiales bacterium]